MVFCAGVSGISSSFGNARSPWYSLRSSDIARFVWGGVARTFRGADRKSGATIVGEKSEAFAKGGCGCLVAFLVIGLFLVLVGGNMHIDIGGAIMLFVIGGVIGLVVLFVYNKGRNSKH